MLFRSVLTCATHNGRTNSSLTEHSEYLIIDTSSNVLIWALFKAKRVAGASFGSPSARLEQALGSWLSLFVETFGHSADQ